MAAAEIASGSPLQSVLVDSCVAGQSPITPERAVSTSGQTQRRTTSFVLLVLSVRRLAFKDADLFENLF